MGMLAEFREFAMKGNVVDMAVGVIIGGAFGKIVTSLVNDVLMPPIGYVTGGIDFKDKAYVLIAKSESSAGVTIQWGVFLNAVIQFLIVAFCLFVVIKAMNTARRRFERKEEAQPGEAPPDIKLLSEIRDLLKARA
jgi:large conductance mechanosensitive channel